ncbi:MAG TPA: LemA family protein [Planctomycetota bacterium]|nr:LemA family protein [Planctomycetota bacterium]
MGPLEIIIAIVAVVVVLAIVVLATSYNKLVTLRNRFRNAFAQIDVQLKRRYDLIPNLVETAKGYMAHEKGVLEEIAKARSAAMAACQRAAGNPADPAAISGLMTAENSLIGMLGQMRVQLEAYPDLKANKNMMQLMEELSSTENRIAFARQAYNDSIMVYNTGRETFPTVLIAGSFGFQPGQLFEIQDAQERQAVKVAVN